MPGGYPTDVPGPRRRYVDTWQIPTVDDGDWRRARLDVDVRMHRHYGLYFIVHVEVPVPPTFEPVVYMVDDPPVEFGSGEWLSSEGTERNPYTLVGDAYLPLVDEDAAAFEATQTMFWLRVIFGPDGVRENYPDQIHLGLSLGEAYLPAPTVDEVPVGSFEIWEWWSPVSHGVRGSIEATGADRGARRSPRPVAGRGGQPTTLSDGLVDGGGGGGGGGGAG